MPSRRDQIAMTPDELNAFVRTEHTLIIVSNGPRGFPHPMPMYFTVDDDNRFYVTTFRKSQKVLNFQRDPRASLLIETGKEYHLIRSMLAYAKAEIIDDLDATLDVIAKVGAKMAKIRSGGEDLREQGRASAPKRVVLRFTPEEIITWDHGKLGGSY